jgi:two-component system LytT family response regulator
VTRLRALIVDDERLARVELARLLAARPEIEVVGDAGGAAEAAQRIAELRPDVVFLDVQMPGRSGFELLDDTDGGFEVVFVTAYDAHALRAFEVNALDYLLKPVNPARLAETVDRLAARRGGRASDRRLDGDDFLFLAGDRRPRFVKVSTIACIRGADDYSEIVLGGGETSLAKRPLKEWEARLPEKRFVRIHRTAIVNLDFVERIERARDEQFLVVLRGVAAPLPMSRRHAARLKLALG